LLFLCSLVGISARRVGLEHFNHSLIFEAISLDTVPMSTPKPQYKGLNTIYSFDDYCADVVLSDGQFWTGSDIDTVVLPVDDYSLCEDLCCQTAACVKWVYTPANPSAWVPGGCPVGTKCCYIKTNAAPLSGALPVGAPIPFYSTKVLATGPDPALSTEKWSCFANRATSLRGSEIGHVELCTIGVLTSPFQRSLWVAKLIVEDVGTLVVSFHMDGIKNEALSTTTSEWYLYETLLPSTEGSFLTHLNKGEFKSWRGFCYVSATIHTTLNNEGAPILFDFNRVFFDCSYRKPERQRKFA